MTEPPQGPQHDRSEHARAPEPDHAPDQPTYQQPTSGPLFASPEEKKVAAIVHFGGAAGSLVTLGILAFAVPLIVYLTKGQQSTAVREHAVAALNFQLVWSVVAFLVFFPGMCLWFVPNLMIMVVQITFGIIAGRRANEHQLYRYPAAPMFIKR